MSRQSDLRYTFDPLRGDPFEVVSFTLEEGLSQPFKLITSGHLMAEILTHPGFSDCGLDRVTSPLGKAWALIRKKGAINDRPKYNERSFSKTTS